MKPKPRPPLAYVEPFEKTMISPVPSINTRSALKLALTFALGLLLYACDDNRGVQLRYAIEKDLHATTRFADRLRIRPELVTPAQEAELYRQYVAIFRKSMASLDSLDRTSDELSAKEIEVLAFVAAHHAQEIDYQRGAYASAYAMLRELVSGTNLLSLEFFQARLNLGRAAQALGRWDEAVRLYDSLIAAYNPPFDNQGAIIYAAVNMPMEIYLAELRAGDSDLAHGRVRSIERYYQYLLDSFDNSELRNHTHKLLASFYRYESRFTEAVEHSRQVVDSAGKQTAEARLTEWSVIAEDLGDYQNVIREMNATTFTGEDSALNFERLYRIAEYYMALDNTDSARSTLYNLKTRYENEFGQSATPQRLIALSFARDNNWDRAENEFRWLIDNYIFSPEAYTAHIELLAHYVEVKDQRKSDVWRERALAFYDQSIARYAGRSLEAHAYRYKAEVLRLMKDWRGAAAALSIVAEKYPLTDVGRESALQAASIYKHELSDLRMTDSLIKIFRSSFPTGPMVPGETQPQ